MGTGDFQIAEVNISRLNSPLDSSSTTKFVEVNRFATESPGYECTAATATEYFKILYFHAQSNPSLRQSEMLV